jgi:hypothetical protein
MLVRVAFLDILIVKIAARQSTECTNVARRMLK